jgi:glycerate kinase
VRFLIAPDKFKGSATAAEVAEQIASGIRDVMGTPDIEIAPIADGGEGTAEVICAARGGEWISCKARDAFGHLITARYVWLRDTNTAVMEMSEAAGMRRVSERDPLRANTFGVGEMILDAAKRGAREIIVGLGGSATNDGGFGMARALGFQFVDSADRELDWFNQSSSHQLIHIRKPAELSLPVIKAAVDVRNPLLGERGATRVFGPQKGAAPDQVVILEDALSRLADVVARDLGCDFRNAPGAGAAGGLGFGLMSFCDARICWGFDLVADAIELREKIARADVVVTGEGRLDAQTLEGKGPARVAELARQSNKPVFAIVGEADESATAMFERVFALVRSRIDRTSAIQNASQLIRERAREFAHFYFDSEKAN